MTALHTSQFYAGTCRSAFQVKKKEFSDLVVIQQQGNNLALWMIEDFNIQSANNEEKLQMQPKREFYLLYGQNYRKHSEAQMTGRA